jgi:hypothetical protein
MLASSILLNLKYGILSLLKDLTSQQLVFQEAVHIIRLMTFQILGNMFLVNLKVMEGECSRYHLETILQIPPLKLLRLLGQVHTDRHQTSDSTTKLTYSKNPHLQSSRVE